MSKAVTFVMALHDSSGITTSLRWYTINTHLLICSIVGVKLYFNKLNRFITAFYSRINRFSKYVIINKVTYLIHVQGVQKRNRYQTVHNFLIIDLSEIFSTTVVL